MGKTANVGGSTGEEKLGYCGAKHASNGGSLSGTHASALSMLWRATGSGSAATDQGGNYDKTSTEKMGNHTSATISKGKIYIQ